MEKLIIISTILSIVNTILSIKKQMTNSRKSQIRQKNQKQNSGYKREDVLYSLISFKKAGYFSVYTERPVRGGSAPFNPPKIKSKGAKKMEDKIEKKSQNEPDQIR